METISNKIASLAMSINESEQRTLNTKITSFTLNS